MAFLSLFTLFCAAISGSGSSSFSTASTEGSVCTGAYVCVNYAPWTPSPYVGGEKLAVERICLNRALAQDCFKKTLEEKDCQNQESVAYEKSTMNFSASIHQLCQEKCDQVCSLNLPEKIRDAQSLVITTRNCLAFKTVLSCMNGLECDWKKLKQTQADVEKAVNEDCPKLNNSAGLVFPSLLSVALAVMVAHMA